MKTTVYLIHVNCSQFDHAQKCNILCKFLILAATDQGLLLANSHHLSVCRSYELVVVKAKKWIAKQIENTDEIFNTLCLSFNKHFSRDATRYEM